MGNLKPIGSEKLQGTDKLSRILEIARYNEHMPKPVNEDKSVEYTKTLADGNEYSIVKEKNGYVIKKSLNESVGSDYVEPMKNRKYYSSYSQAFKRLNLIAKEININEGHDKNISLFEAADEATKYILKFGETKEQAPAPAAPAPAAPAPAAPAPVAEPAPETPVDDVEMDVDVEDVENAPEEEEKVTYKTIQKLTGKLAQKIRAFNDDEDKEESMSSKDIKYVINSVLSALNLNDLEEDDVESIINKLEGVEGEGDMEGDEEVVDVDMETAEPVAEPEGEMAEGEEFEGNPDELVDYLFSDLEEEIGVDTNEEDSHMKKVEEMIEGIFTESKVDNILQKYFSLNENEKKEVKYKRNQLVEVKRNTINKIKNVSESVSQKVASTKLVSKYPKIKLVGKTSKKNLVFEMNDKQYRVTTKGQIL